MELKKLKKSLKKYSFYIILLMLQFVMVKCVMVFDVFFDNPEKSPYIQKGDTLIFISKSDADTFYVKQAKLYSAGESEIGDDPEIVVWSKNRNRYISFMAQINCVDSCYKFSSSINSSEYWVGVQGFERAAFPLIDNAERYSNLTLQVGEYQLEDLYKDGGILCKNVTGKEISAVYYSKTYGVVQYELYNGDVYNLADACIAMLDKRKKKK